RRLSGLLSQGMAVLDVGCGTGAITAGIARAVGPTGWAVGIDRDPSLLAIAREEHGSLENLSFEEGDALSIPFDSIFDVATAARTLQWISRPEEAAAQMARTVKRGGLIVLLDYNHVNNTWEPDPPPAFRHFYDAFLAWRESNGWDNRIGGRLAALLLGAG